MLIVAIIAVAACSSGGEPDATAPTSPSQAPLTATRALEATATATLTAVPASPTPTPPPATTSPATPLVRGPATRRAVALTFDAGADRGFAEQILGTLAKEDVKAGFGMTGQWAHQHSDLVRRIGAEGHVFINHTFSHRSFTGLSTTSAPMPQAMRFSELDQTEEIIKSITGLTTKPYFRPPYGDYDASVNHDVGLRGYSSNVLWTVDSRGWMGLSAAEIAQRCLALAEPGAIYVFHVGAASQDAEALPAIIAGLRAQGYELVLFSSFAQD
jgi:peptidoglycan/xylan/chitin deacetylase (PgdA/CDA1 family)